MLETFILAKLSLPFMFLVLLGDGRMGYFSNWMIMSLEREKEKKQKVMQDGKGKNIRWRGSLG
jgi:hypothetical protein